MGSATGETQAAAVSPPAHAVTFSRRRYVLRSLERLVYIDDFFICEQYVPDWCELQAFRA
ncbi:hypothetical protein WJ29_25390 [Burkholderia ubonensis]|nr:hypothetical protein WJ29_25390 [Burkholderia ubonensis]